VWRTVRIAILLLILAIAAWSNFYDRLSTTDWDETLTVGVFPVDEAGDAGTRAYLSRLSNSEIADVERFLNEEAREYGISISRPVSVQMYPRVTEHPPERDPDSGMLGNVWWSLKMRWYARRAALSTGKPMPQIRIFVRYHVPSFTQGLPHSVGLQKGLVGVVHAYADADLRGSNNVVIAHEILHTLGASDKYDLATLAPLYPAGYAEPGRSPRFPQPFAEIMAGRRALSATEFEMPSSLDQVIVGTATALEIGWVKP
jgi:hypothetical protein